MAMDTQMPQAKSTYNPRWFIWTIVFLVVAGISLVSYIVLSDTGATVTPDFARTKAQTKTATSTTPKTPVKTK